MIAFSDSGQAKKAVRQWEFSSVPGEVGMCCSVFCGSAVGCSVLQFAVVYYDALQCITVRYGVLMKGGQAMVVFTGARGGSHVF